MNKMKYLGERDGRNVNDRDDTHNVLWMRNDRSQVVRRSQPNTSFYSWTVPYLFFPKDRTKIAMMIPAKTTATKIAIPLWFCKNF